MIKLSPLLSLAVSLTVLSVIPNQITQAQITPDNTLGAESSTIRQDTIKNLPSDVIEGGASRGSNLFHSFQEFNVNEGRGAYFANPAVIQNIFSRVTGGNISQILGTLGVLGNANLYLINPNGIIFGPNARLDMRGAFVGSTADSLLFNNNYEFSASNPTAAPLLTVDIPLGVRFRENTGDINSTANLATPNDLTLQGGNVNLTGSVVAGGNLRLEALDSLTIRDSLEIPFFALSGQDLLIQGTNIDIFALNHPQSAIASYGNLTLKSPNLVLGDAHYYSGGSFRIEQFDGSLGNLLSLDDPVIRSLGDVTFDSYQGASLHIIAGGKVEIPGFIFITESDLLEGLSERITLSSGENLSIIGSFEPTLDIRAGVDSSAVGIPIEQIGTGIFIPFILSTDSPTSADIIIGDVSIFDVLMGTGGKVLLNNQYFPNQELTGNITINSIDTQDFFGGGSIIVDSRGGINLNGSVDASADSSLGLFLGNGGDITLLAQDNITTSSGILTKGAVGGNVLLNTPKDVLFTNVAELNVRGGQGGNIALNAQNITLSGESKIRAGIDLGLGSIDSQAGNIMINASGVLTIADGSLISNAVIGRGSGNTGDVLINTGSLILNNNAQINTVVFELAEGNAGLVKIDASENVEINDNSAVISDINSGVAGNAKGVEINANSLFVTSESRIQSRNIGTGNAGQLTVRVNDLVTVSDGSLLSDKDSSTMGNSGNIEISGSSISFSNSQLFAGNTGMGNAGRIIIKADDSVALSNSLIDSNIGSFSGLEAVGKVGTIILEAKSISITDNSQLQASILSNGIGEEEGLISIQATDIVSLIDTMIFTDVSFGGIGKGGNVEIIVENGNISLNNSNIFTNTSSQDDQSGDISVFANSLRMINNSDLSSFTGGSNSKAGNVTIITNESVTLEQESGINVFASGLGIGGNAFIETGEVKILNGSGILGSVTDQQGGNLVINASESVEVSGSVETIPNIFSGSRIGMVTLGNGDAGNIEINTKNLVVKDGGYISTQALTGRTDVGNGGSIFINASEIQVKGTTPDALNISGIRSDTSGKGNAGNIEINTEKLIVSDGATVSSFTVLGSSGKGGMINIHTNESIEIIGTRPPLNVSPTTLDTSSGGTGDAGDINIFTSNLIVEDGGQINSSTSNFGQAGSINITAINSINITGTSPDFSLITSKFTSETLRSGNAGNITINTPQLTISDGASIEAFTEGEGRAGNITINASESIILNTDTRLIVESRNAGTAGDINIDTPLLTIGENAQLSATATETSTAPTAGNINLNVNQLNIAGELGIFAETNSTPTAGSLTIQPYQFDRQDAYPTNPNLNIQFTENGFVSARATSIGNGGSISITAPENIDLRGLGSITAETSGEGNAGNINFDTANLIISDSTNITTSTNSAGNAGLITVNSTESIFLTNQAQITSEVRNTATGNSEGIVINTPTLTVNDSSQISAATSGEGNAGNIDISTQQLELNNQSIINAFTNGIGNAGNLNLSTSDLTLDNRSQINAFTDGVGNAGSININNQGKNSDQVSFNNNSQISTEIRENGIATQPSNINLTTEELNLTNNSTISASTAGDGNAGKITVTADNLTLTNQSVIETNTASKGEAGDIILNIQDYLNINDSTIAASTEINSTGRGGDIIINSPPVINLDNNASITVNSQGEGDGGNISLATVNLTLNDNSTISATTASGEGGNLTFNVAENLIQKNNSPISATAGGTGNGGNITIETEYLIGSNNSPITANAFEGNGGNINITAKGIFRDLGSPITASSELGVDGIVETNTPEVDPSRGLVNLPTNIVDANDLIAKNACRQGNQSEFTVRGKGGLPSSPQQISNSSEIEVGLVESTQEVSTSELKSNQAVINDNNDNDNDRKIIPAQGWQRNEKGELVLVAYTTEKAVNRKDNSQVTCPSN